MRSIVNEMESDKRRYNHQDAAALVSLSPLGRWNHVGPMSLPFWRALGQGNRRDASSKAPLSGFWQSFEVQS